MAITTKDNVYSRKGIKAVTTHAMHWKYRIEYSIHIFNKDLASPVTNVLKFATLLCYI